MIGSSAWVMALALLGLLISYERAAAEAELPGVDSQSAIMLGTCELKLDPVTVEGREALGPMACLKASLGVEMIFVSGTPEENAWLKYGRVYGGVFLTPWMAAQARGRARVLVPLGDQAGESDEALTEYAVMQLGNPALHSVRLTAGKIKLPFGVDRSDAGERYQSIEDRRFWSSPEHGAYVTWDNRTSVQVDLGYATNSLAERKLKDDQIDENRAPAEHAVSIRLMGDFAALDGSRLVLSGYGEEDGARRMGAGFVTVSLKDDVTHFEFVRRLTASAGGAEPFAQLLRLGYVGSWRGDTRWLLQVDDERFRFRRGVIGYDARLFGHAILRFSVAYHKSETGDDQRRWYVTSGMEARL